MPHLYVFVIINKNIDQNISIEPLFAEWKRPVRGSGRTNVSVRRSWLDRSFKKQALSL